MPAGFAVQDTVSIIQYITLQSHILLFYLVWKRGESLDRTNQGRHIRHDRGATATRSSLASEEKREALFAVRSAAHVVLFTCISTCSTALQWMGGDGGVAGELGGFYTWHAYALRSVAGRDGVIHGDR